MIGSIVAWLFDGANWTPDQFGTCIQQRIVEHLEYSFGALFFVLLIGIPLGLYVGHTGRGAVAVAGTANALRALPTFGLMVYLVITFTGGLPADWTYLGPMLFVLVVLGVPAVLSNTYAGIQNVDPAARDAARGMGMTGRQVLWQVEVPNALPLIISGIRSALLQIVATATIAAYVTLGGLGRYIIDGLAQRDYAQMAGGAVLVGVLAVLLDLLMALVQRYAVSRGVTGRYARPGAGERPDRSEVPT